MRIHIQQWLLMGLTTFSLLAFSQMFYQDVQAKTNDTTDPTPELMAYVGHLDGNENAAVIIGTGNGVASVYVAGLASTAEWFWGDIGPDGSLDLINSTSIHLEVILTEQDAVGTFTFPDGTVKAFRIKRSLQEAGLFSNELPSSNDVLKSSLFIQSH